MPYLRPVEQELPFETGSATSRDAAVQAATFAGDQRDRYFVWVRSRGEFGATDGEAEQVLSMKRSSVCARRNELMADGLIVKTDRRRGGCAVWRAR